MGIWRSCKKWGWLLGAGIGLLFLAAGAIWASVCGLAKA
mgnify:CR=1 FL=1